MYHRGRMKMRHMILIAVLLLSYPTYTLHKSIATHQLDTDVLDDNIENTIIDFEEDYTVKFNKKHGTPWNTDDYFNKESHRYTLVNDYDKNVYAKRQNETKILGEETTTEDFSVIPLELISTTENVASVVDSTVETDLSVIPLDATENSQKIVIKQTVVLPTTTEGSVTTTELVNANIETTTLDIENITKSQTSINHLVTANIVTKNKTNENVTQFSVTDKYNYTTELDLTTSEESITSSINHEVQTTFEPLTNSTKAEKVNKTIEAFNNKDTNITKSENSKKVQSNKNITVANARHENIKRNISIFNSKDAYTNSSTSNSEQKYTTAVPRRNSTGDRNRSDTMNSTEEPDVPIFTELDTEDQADVAEDYYDSKDVVPTTAPKTDALSVIFGLAGSVVESVAERVVPKSIFDLFKRMQRQNEALEAERLRSREENGGLGQFGRGILKSISTGITRPFSQLMAGARDIGSLDNDRGFVTSLASGVTSVANVANSVVDTFKDRVQAIYPGTVWCGDGRSTTARPSDLGLFFFTDTCCRQHDACKLYILSGETKYGLTNTGLFTRSHCSCDAKFRECLVRTNSLVSAQIGLTYFNVLGPQCFRRAHPIVRCVRRTRITGQKCEEYELDYTKPRMWQWFDNETF